MLGVLDCRQMALEKLDTGPAAEFVHMEAVAD